MGTERVIRVGAPTHKEQVDGFTRFRRRHEKQNKLRQKKTLGTGFEDDGVEELDAEAIENGHINGSDFLGEEE